MLLLRLLREGYRHGQSLESSKDDTFPRAYVLGSVAALQPQGSLLDTPKVRAETLGGWLVTEKWKSNHRSLLNGARITLQSTSKGPLVLGGGGGGGQVLVNSTGRAVVSTWETFKAVPTLSLSLARTKPTPRLLFLSSE